MDEITLCSFNPNCICFAFKSLLFSTSKESYYQCITTTQSSTNLCDLPKHSWLIIFKCLKQISLFDPVQLNAATKLLLLSVVVTTKLSVEGCQFVMIYSIDSVCSSMVIKQWYSLQTERFQFPVVINKMNCVAKVGVCCPACP